MSVYIPDQATAQAFVQSAFGGVIRDALEAAVKVQILAGSSAPLVLDTPTARASIDTITQQIATVSGFAVVHPITGIVVQPGIKSAGT